MSEYNIETVLRAIRLCQELHDLTLSDTIEKLAPVFTQDLIDAAMEKWEEMY